MLMHTRCEGESLFITPAADADLTMTQGELFTGGAIEIIVKQIKGHQARIGLHASAELLILRKEII